MPKKIYEAVQKTTKRHRSRVRQGIIRTIACLIVFCMTYALILPAIAIRDPIISQSEAENDKLDWFFPIENTNPSDSDGSDDRESGVVNLGANLSGIWRDDLLSVATDQLGYVESTGNYVITSDGVTTKGYTLFGDWYGDPYGDWAAMFVSYCLEQAKVNNMPLDNDCQHWVDVLDAKDEALNDVDRYYTPDEYTPVPGDLVFFDREEDGVADHVGIVLEMIDAYGETKAQIKTIEGDSDDKVQEVIYSADDSVIVGYAALPEQPPVFTYTDYGLEVVVSLPEGSTVPKDAVLKVTPIKSDSASYADLTKKAENAVNGSVEKITLYDISFYTADQAYIPVDERAQVTMRFNAPVAGSASSDVVVLHYDDNDSNPVALGGVAAEKPTSSKAAVSFETEGFSTFAVVEVTAKSDVVGVTGLAGKDFIIAGLDNNNNTGPAIMTSDAVAGAGIYDQEQYKPGLIGAHYNDTNELTLVGAEGWDPTNRDGVVTSVIAHGDTTTAIWQFEAVVGSDTAYYIKSLKQDKYLNIAPNSLTLSDNKQAIEVVDHNNDGNVPRYVLRVPVAGSTDFIYLNLCGGAGTNDFTGMTVAGGGYGDNGNHMALWEVNSGVLTNLGGKKYVISSFIANVTTHRALSSTKIGTAQMLGVNVTATYDGTTVLAVNANADESLVWEFETVNAAQGQYRIKSVKTGEYLQVGEQLQDNGVTQLTTVAEQAQASIFTAEHALADDNTFKNGVVCLTANDCKVNLNGDDAANNFIAFNSDSKQHEGNQVILSEFTELPVTNLNGESLAIVSVHNGGVNVKTQAVTSGANGAFLAGVNVTWDGVNKVIGNVPEAADATVYWTFTAVPNAGDGVYHISIDDQYLNITDDGASVSNTPQEITVVTRYINNQESICLYSVVEGVAYYLNRHGGAGSSNYGGWDAIDDGSRFVLAVEVELDSFLDPDETDGTQDEDADDEVIKVVTPVEAPGVKVSIFDYDYRVNLDALSDGLANQVAFDEALEEYLADGHLTAAEVEALDEIKGFRFFQQAPGDDGGVEYQYHDYYTKKYDSQDDDLFNYVIGARATSNTPLYGIGTIYFNNNADPFEIHDPQFTAGEIIFDEMGALDEQKADALNKNGAEDGPGPFWIWNGGTATLADGALVNDVVLGSPLLGSTVNSISVKLDDEGYPYFYTDNPGGFKDNGSWKYLFDTEGVFHEGSMTDGGGLFQVDEDGYYYYHSELNAAYFDGNQFVLYDHVVRPNYTLGTSADKELGNFLPFDSLGDIRDDGTVDYWTNDGDDNNDLDPESFETLDGYGPENQNDYDAQHFNWPVLTDPKYTTINSVALADTNLVNNWFGMMIEIPFYMPAGGQVNGEDMIFSFSGDDDVLVFVDDVLMINLAGVHGAESGSINFTEGTFDHVGAYTVGDKVEGTRDARNFADRFAAAGKTVQLNENGTFEDYSFHTLKFFYMERGGNISHCAIRFNMPALPENSLQVRKELAAGAGSNEEEEFTFRVVETDSEGNATDTLFVKPGTKYYVVANGQVVEGKEDEEVAADGTFKLKSGEGAVFANILENTTTGDVPDIVVQEILGAGVTYDVQYRLSGANNQGLTAGSKNDDQSGPTQTVYETIPISVTAGSQIATFYNSTANTATLEITKKLGAGVTATGEVFNIRVKLAGILIPEGTKYHLTEEGVDGEQTLTVKEEGIIPLMAGQTATILSITPGLTYEVAEFFTNEQNYSPGYVPTYTGTVGPQMRGLAGVNGILQEDQTVTIEITNNLNPISIQIPISKRVVDSYEADNFFFNVEQGTWANNVWTPVENGARPGSMIKWDYDADRIQNGTVAIGFPAETADGNYFFKISEDPGAGAYNYDSTYYIVEVNKTGNAVTIQNIWKNGTESVGIDTRLSFENTKTTSVTIKKQIEGVIHLSDEFEFTAKITDKNGNLVTEAIVGGVKQTSTSGEYTFTLKHNGSIVISGLPIGAVVQVVEKDRLDYNESYEVNAKYEAEYGTPNSATVVTDSSADSASGEAFVGGINGSTQTVTIPVYVASAIAADLKFCYGTWSDRKFTVNVGSDTLTSDTLNSGDWHLWKMSDSPIILPTLTASTEAQLIANNLVIGGDGAAPNLDYIELAYSADGNTAIVNLLGDGAEITFINKPSSKVTIEKEVTGATTEGEFEFTVTITDAEGQSVTSAKDKDGKLITANDDGEFTFKLKDGESFVFDDLPVGAIVKVIENNADGYYTSTNTRYEAEEAELNGAALVKQDAASGGYVIGNIGGGENRMLTFTVYSSANQNVSLKLCYSTLESRQFNITVNGAEPIQTESLSTGVWHSWVTPGYVTLTDIPLIAGDNTIEIGGVANDQGGFADAPNLDYIEIIETGTSVSIKADHDTILHYINEAGYELPETGGIGTTPYTLGGLLLMAVPLLYGYRRKRKRERGADE